MAKTIRVNETPLVLYTLRRADDALILGHRLSEWCGHAPMMEEDMALANMALDLIGQARSLYTYAGEAEGEGRTEDDFAYWRDERGYRNLLLVEQQNGDFARTILRQFLYANFAVKFIREELLHSATPGDPNTTEWEAVTDAGASTVANRPPLIRVWQHLDRL